MKNGIFKISGVLFLALFLTTGCNKKSSDGNSPFDVAQVEVTNTNSDTSTSDQSSNAGNPNVQNQQPKQGISNYHELYDSITSTFVTYDQYYIRTNDGLIRTFNTEEDIEVNLMDLQGTLRGIKLPLIDLDLNSSYLDIVEVGIRLKEGHNDSLINFDDGSNCHPQVPHWMIFYSEAPVTVKTDGIYLVKVQYSNLNSVQLDCRSQSEHDKKKKKHKKKHHDIEKHQGDDKDDDIKGDDPSSYSISLKSLIESDDFAGMNLYSSGKKYNDDKHQECGNDGDCQLKCKIVNQRQLSNDIVNIEDET